jgi:hypothetical protein
MEIPLFERLKNCNRVLLAGAGGGCDFLHGVPLYFFLKGLRKQVFFANLSFSNFFGVNGRQVTPTMVEVRHDAGGSKYYFPEKHLSAWFRLRGEDVPIYTFHRTGVVPLLESYKVLVSELNLDAIVLVDGGSDSLMRGDETGLGTPQEDLASITAVSTLNVKEKLLTCIGFGVDAYHGVNHAQYLESVAAISKDGGYLGAMSLLDSMPEAKLYKSAVDFVIAAMPEHPSIVASSIISALEGQFGDVHRTELTRGSKLWINPLMSFFWGFDVDCVARRCLYMNDIRQTESYQELTLAIKTFRAKLPAIRPPDSIPV